MTEPTGQPDAEIQAAAAEGAAAAVNAVQDRQETEETVQQAEVLAEVSAETASDALTVAHFADASAMDAQETADNAAGVAEAAVGGVLTLDERFSAYETKQDERWEEMRGLLARMVPPETTAEPTVTEVHVNGEPGNNDESGSSGSDSGSGGTGESGTSGTAESASSPVRRSRGGFKRGGRR